MSKLPNLISLINGRKIASPKGAARPSAVRARQSLFDVLNHRLALDWQGKQVLDGFAGAGTLGFEALLQGAAAAVFIDREPEAIAHIKESAEKLNVAAQTIVLCRTMLKLNKPPRSLPPVDIVFLDPPYHKNLAAPALRSLAAGGWLSEEALIIVEAASDEPLAFENFNVLVEHKVGRQCWHILTAMK